MSCMTIMTSPIELPLVARARSHAGRTAVVAREGEFRYRDLLAASARVAAALLDSADDLEEARVAFLIPPSFAYVAVQWGVWRAGGIAVPLAVSHPPRELAYVLDDARPAMVLAHPEFAARLRPLARERGIRFLATDEALTVLPTREPGRLPTVAEDRRAHMLYTSGTTGQPKGVVTSHANERARVETLVDAWGWTRDDRILGVLPLHHVHGIINVLTCALWSGGCCEILPAFDANAVWGRIGSGDLTLFMAVPTIYLRLIAAWDASPPGRREALSAGARRMRLMISGSAALPVPTLERWREISGHTLLERYGMTEIGMALSNPLEGERVVGHVGAPLPRVEVRLATEHGEPPAPGRPGEIHVRGPGVFREYWGRPQATREAFTDDGWFRTGDVATAEDGVYRILGRSSVDIIKTGGYKVSALEVEDVLRTHPAVRDCAVVGVPDEEWGERVCAAVTPAGDAMPGPDVLRAWAKERLAPYKAPTVFVTVDALPRNALGKVMKPDVRMLFQA